MAAPISELLDRRIPDEVSTSELDPVGAAEIDYLAGRTERWTDPAVPSGVRARALVTCGRHGEARELLDALDVEAEPVHGQFAAAWAASRVGTVATIQRLSALWPSGMTHFVVDHDVPLGPASLPCGLLAAARGDLVVADRELSAAVAAGDARAPVWGARARLELTRVLLDRETLDGTHLHSGRARHALGSARLFFEAGGYRALAQRAHRLDALPSPMAMASPRLGHLVPGNEAWTVGYGVQPTVTLTPSAGLVALRHLVARPGSTVLAVQLSDVIDGGPGTLTTIDEAALATLSEAELKRIIFDDRARSRVSKAISRALTRLAVAHPLLAALLASRVSTGNRCHFNADAQMVWRLDAACRQSR